MKLTRRQQMAARAISRQRRAREAAASLPPDHPDRFREAALPESGATPAYLKENPNSAMLRTLDGNDRSAQRVGDLREAIEVVCPECGQRRGQWCGDGEMLHDARISLARRAGIWHRKSQMPGSVFR